MWEKVGPIVGGDGAIHGEAKFQSFTGYTLNFWEMFF